jgi:drug/metabolite transporter (DMT)-like permease
MTTLSAVHDIEARSQRAWAGLRGDVLAVGAVVNWGLSYGLTKRAFQEWRPLPFTATRFVAMAAVAAVVLALQGRLRLPFGPDAPRFARAGLFGFALYQLGFILGLDRTSAFSSTLLLATGFPLFSLLFLRLGGVETVTRRQWAGVGLAAIGIGLFVGAKTGGPRLADARLGDLLSLAAAASFALYGIVTKPLAARYPPSTVLAGSLLLGSPPLILLGFWSSVPQDWGRISVTGWGIWAYAVVVPVYLAYTWWTAAIADRGVAAIAPYALLVPVAGGLFAWLWLGERLTVVQGIGTGMALLGLALGRNWLPRAEHGRLSGLLPSYKRAARAEDKDPDWPRRASP